MMELARLLRRANSTNIALEEWRRFDRELQLGRFGKTEYGCFRVFRPVVRTLRLAWTDSMT